MILISRISCVSGRVCARKPAGMEKQNDFSLLFTICDIFVVLIDLLHLQCDKRVKDTKTHIAPS